MRYLRKTLFVFCLLASSNLLAQRGNYTFEEGWMFTKNDDSRFASPGFQTKGWQHVTVPHDWAIAGPFSVDNDKQFVAIEQDGQKEAQSQAGRTGGLPFIGTGWYRLKFKAPEFTDGKRAFLIFDGAMSHAKVYVNGHEAGYWPYGYNSFWLDVSPYLMKNGGENTLAVRLENEPKSSRWYPGAGLYRNVHLRITDAVHIPVWGVHVTTPVVNADFARVNVNVTVSAPEQDNAKSNITVRTRIVDDTGVEIAKDDKKLTDYDGNVAALSMIVDKPKLWDCDNPVLYKAVSEVYRDGRQTDADTTVFGIRSIEVKPMKGFYLNGKRTVFKGVCLHHDLGPLGTAVNEAAIRRQVRILKDMGCNAIRTSHNMPAPELVRICNETGMMLMLESFDEWKTPKMENGYNKFFDEWVEKDIVNEVRHYRNDPSVVFWCIGNEVPDQGVSGGAKLCKMIQDIFHREDPTRPCTFGSDQVKAAMTNNFLAVPDVPGFNYRVPLIENSFKILPQQTVIGSETASTVSSRGVYKFPVERKAMAVYTDNQSSSYDVEKCSWSELPEDNFILTDFLPYYMGEFVWTGFDYLGEPTPYYDNWPSHSSYFGIIDLAGIPKDRYYLYRSYWKPEAETLHILPHWSWKGREGKVTPVFVYTNYPEVELFINGKSQGRRKKDMSVSLEDSKSEDSLQALVLQRRYRLMWMDTKYEPGTVKAVAYNEKGEKMAEAEVSTAQAPARIELTPDRRTIHADGKDLCFVTVRVVDKDGNLCPEASDLIHFSVKGAGLYRAGANGDPTCLEPFARPQMHLFNGMMTAIVQSVKGKPGRITLEATGKGLKKATAEIISASSDLRK